MPKVTFDGVNKLIIVNDGITELDVQVDLYSDWKEWIQQDDNSKYVPAMRTVGGDPTTGTKSVAPYFFLTNGWKIKPYEGNHTLLITGNLFVDEPEIYGFNLTVPTLGAYTVTVVLSTTSDAITLTPGLDLTDIKTDLINIKDDLSFVRSIQEGRWKIMNNQMIFYKADNVTEILRFRLLDKNGLPTEVNVFDRQRI